TTTSQSPVAPLMSLEGLLCTFIILKSRVSGATSRPDRHRARCRTRLTTVALSCLERLAEGYAMICPKFRVALPMILSLTAIEPLLAQQPASFQFGLVG